MARISTIGLSLRANRKAPGCPQPERTDGAVAENAFRELLTAPHHRALPMEVENHLGVDAQVVDSGSLAEVRQSPMPSWMQSPSLMRRKHSRDLQAAPR